MRLLLGTGISSIILFALPLAADSTFQENKGQSRGPVQFVANFKGAVVRAYPGFLEFQLPGAPALRLQAGSNVQPWEAELPGKEAVSYQIGSDQSHWVENARTYQRLRLRDVQPGVDWIVYWQGSNIEYDFELSEEASLDELKISAQGLPLELSDGCLSARWGTWTWTQRPPRFFAAGGRELAGSLVEAHPGNFRFVLHEARPPGPLRIDPIVEVSGRVGGPEDDRILSANSQFAIGITRSSAWDRAANGSGWDVFLRVYRGGGAYRTIFWGGEGDEILSSATQFHDRNNSLELAFAAGSTNSRDLPIPAKNGGRDPWSYGGGETDGLWITANATGLSGETVGGPGHEVLHGIQLGPSNIVFLGGESRASASDDVQALFGYVWEGKTQIWIGGGAGTDRIRRLARETVLLDGQPTATRVHFIGETESDAINGQSPSWSRRAGGRDIWYGSFVVPVNPTQDPDFFLYPERSAIWGGGGDEDAGAIEFVPGRGIYLLGSTNSDNLPLHRPAIPAYRGGASDGFILRLDLSTASPAHATYWGGSGEDRILAAHAALGDLLIGGATDSPDLNLPGDPLTPNSSSGLDGFAALLSAQGATDWFTQFGGPGRDIVHFVFPGHDGLWLGGESTELSWLESLTPLLRLEAPASTFSSLQGSAGGADAFLLRFRSTLVGLSDLRVGANLESPVSLQIMLEPGFDGMLTVESLDPTRALLALPGEDPRPKITFFLLREPTTSSSLPDFFLHSLGIEGETELLLKAAGMPDRRLTVNVLPSALFASAKRVTHPLNTIQSYAAYTAAVDPVTTLPLLKQKPRSGLDPLFSLLPSDPEALAPAPRTYYDSHELLTQSVELRKSGSFTLTPQSPIFPTAPNQSITVLSPDRNPAPDFPTRLLAPRSLSFPVNLPHNAPAGAYSIHAEPSGALLFTQQPALRGTPTFTFQSNSSTRTFYVQADGDFGDVKLIVDGPEAWSRSVEIHIAPTRVSFKPSAVEVARGQTMYFQISFSTKAVPGYGVAEGYYPVSIYNYAQLPLLPNLQVVVQPAPLAIRTIVNRTSAELYETFFLSGAGRAEFSLIGVPDHFIADTPLRRQVDILPPTLRSFESEIVLPQGVRRSLNVTPFLSPTSAAKVSVAFSTPDVARVVQFNPAGDTTINYTQPSWGYSVNIEALGPPGSRTVLKLTSEDGALTQIPVRIVPSFLEPLFDSYLIQKSSQIELRIVGRDGNLLLPGPFQLAEPNAELLVTSSRPDICSVPPSIRVDGYRPNFTLNCSTPGETELTIRPATVLTRENSLRIRVKSGDNPLTAAARPPFSNTSYYFDRVILGTGLQRTFIRQLQINFQPVVAVRSEDPSLVVLSSSAAAAGTASLAFSAQDYGLVYVQSLGGTGQTTLVFTNSAGEESRVPVSVWPATIAFPRGRFAEPESRFLLEGVLPMNVRVPFQLAVIPPNSLSNSLSNSQSDFAEPFMGNVPSHLYLSPFSDLLLIRAKSSNPAVAELIPPTPILSESSSELFFSLRLHSAGESMLDIELPAAFAPSAFSRLRVVATTPKLVLNEPLILGEGTQRSLAIAVNNSGAYPRQPVTITSSNPEALLLATSVSGPSAPSITVDTGAFFYVRCLRADPAFLELSSSLLGMERVPASYEPVGVIWQDYSPFLNWTGRPGQRILVSAKLDFLTAIGKRYSNGITPLPDSPWRVYLRSSDESVAPMITSGEFTRQPGTATFTYSFVAGALGEAKLELEATGGLAVQAPPAFFKVSPWVLGPSGGVVGRAEVERISFYLEQGAPTEFIVTSSNPAFALGRTPQEVSTAPLSISARPNSYVEFFLSAPLAEASTALSLQGPNLAGQPVNYTSRPNHFSFAFPNGVSPIADLFRQTFEVPIQLGGYNYSQSAYGLNYLVGPQTLTLSSSNPTVADFASPNLTWQPGEKARTVLLRLHSIGSTILKVQAPPGFGGAPPEIRLTVR